MADEKPKPRYFKYAFSNPYNYALMGGFASAAALTGNWWLGVAGAGMEALWLLFAPDSRLLRRFWFDKVFAGEQAAAAQAALASKLGNLDGAAKHRCLELLQKQEQINGLARENPAFTVDLLSGELTKLGDLVAAFIELSTATARYKEYIDSVDLDDIERDLRRYRKTLEDADPKKGSPDARALAQKNLAVLEKRRDKYAEITNYLNAARGQLDLIENSFRLLADQIVTMRSPQELSGQLTELLDGVEAVRQTTRETEKLMQTLER